jgi:ATP-binding cassette subfamily B protein
MPKFPFYRQLDAMTHLPVHIIAKYYGRNISLDFLRNKTQYGRSGVSLLGLADAAEAIGFKPLGVKISFEQLIKDVPLPAILHWQQNHYVVAVRQISPRWGDKGGLLIADPAKGIIKLTKEEFLKGWISSPLSVRRGAGGEASGAQADFSPVGEIKGGFSKLLPHSIH